MNTSKMKRAAFKTGQIVEYLGDRYATDEKGRVLISKGMRFTIVETKEPQKGIGKFGIDEETGEDRIDYDDDGYNVYKPYPDTHGRIIWPADKKDWKLIK